MSEGLLGSGLRKGTKKRTDQKGRKGRKGTSLFRIKGKENLRKTIRVRIQ